MKILTFVTVIVPSLLCAQSLSLPIYLQQSFDGPGIPAGWTVTQINGPLATWRVVGTGTNPPVQPYLVPGQAKFNSYDAGPGEQARLTSPSVDLSTANDPFLEFQTYHDDEFISSFDSVYVEISIEDSIAGPWSIVRGIRRPHLSNAWEKVAVSLLDYRGNNRVFISIRGISQYGNNIYVDELRIADSSFHDIGTVTFLQGDVIQHQPMKEDQRGRNLHSGEATQISMFQWTMNPLTLSVVVQNYGTLAESTYRILWELDAEGQNPIENSSVLPRNALDTVELQLPQLAAGTHPISAWTELSGDLNNANDTVRIVLLVQDSSIIFSEGFNDPAFPPVGWSVINRDGGVLGPWFRGSATSLFLPYEGQGFAGNNFQRANGQYIDDYLISPSITGIATGNAEDSLFLWTRSAFNPPPSANYPDSLMILLSTAGSDTSDFITVLDYFDVPKSGWTRQSYRLSGLVPQGSDIYIAFRYLHYNGGSSGTGSDFIGVDAVQINRSLPLAVPIDGEFPAKFSLEQNYPNPFNPTTVIEFQVPGSQWVSLRVFDVLGREVSTLVDGTLSPGAYSRIFDGRNLSSGMYYSLLRAGGHQEAKKMMLIR